MPVLSPLSQRAARVREHDAPVGGIGAGSLGTVFVCGGFEVKFTTAKQIYAGEKELQDCAEDLKRLQRDRP
jgi:hypothetical protein